MKLRSNSYPIFIAATVVAHVIFFMLSLHYKRIYMGDSYEYVYMALNIKDGGLFYAGNAALPLLVKNYTLRPPGYSLALLIVYLFSVNNWIVILLQNLLSIFNVCYTRNLLIRLGFKKKYDWLLLLLLLAYPAQFIYANTIAPDLLLQTCVILYCGHFVSLVDTKHLRYAWMMSVALTVGIFVKPILLMFLPVHIAVLAWLCFRSGIAKAALVALLLPAGSVLAYNSWNLQRTGKFHFTSIQPWNGMYYNMRMFQEHRLGRDSATSFMQEEQRKWDETNNFKEWYDYGNERSMEFLKEHFVPYMAFHLKYTFQFFIHPGKGEIDLFTGKLTYGRFFAKKDKRILQILSETPVGQWGAYFRSHPSVIVMFVVLLFNMLKIPGAVFFFFLSSIDWRIRALLLLVIGYFAFLTGPLANTRYHLPVSLIFIACSVLGYQHLLQRRKNQRIITA